ncbi:MAG: hypothetical protein L3J59_16135 [Methylococcaceae bacterium]|nr:hypothetical protein [Methylococcaceae bacterium]
MINLISKKGLLLSTSVLLIGATQADLLTSPNSNNDIQTRKTYTAKGTTNYKTALMIKNLLKNPYLRVEAYTGKQQSKNQNIIGNNHSDADILISYTIKGTTTKRNALKLKKLFETNQHISVSTNILVSRQGSVTELSRNQQEATHSYSTHYPEYTPFYYKGVPPTYTNGRTLWMPVKIEERQVAKMRIVVHPERKIASN